MRLEKRRKITKFFEKEYENEVVPTVAFLDEKTSVLIGNDMLVFYSGLEDLQQVKKIKIKKEIKSVSYDKSGVALVTEKFWKKRILNCAFIIQRGNRYCQRF